LKYKIVIEKRVEKDTARIPAHDKANIDQAILSLATDPRPHGCKKLTDREGYRIRVGNYRILYTIDDETQVVVVYRIKIRLNMCFRVLSNQQI